ncbi:aspartyl/glutamyl-tRNA amidotransferase subunit B [Globomyces pollinis-pini]|nr:aspartyl/glutamyl-tRNA amidotransferase subunit B [Globomyces pollinis-pini]
MTLRQLGFCWETVIGLEIHSRMSSNLKLFSKAQTSSSTPNHSVALFDAAIPGSMPVINRNCILLATKAALALKSVINEECTFDRKHYFYHDLPSGYQITQFFKPFATSGEVSFMTDSVIKNVKIEQIQIEQDSAKSLTDNDGKVLIDLNRAGVGILEIVTKPDLRSSNDTVVFLKTIQQLLWYSGIAPMEMDDGSFRCDVNISVRKAGEEFGNRVELKHIHKFSSIGIAIDYEKDRQIEILENGGQIDQETRGFDPDTKSTFSLREKEEINEYYFMQDPDIPVIKLSKEYIEKVSNSLPESLDVRRSRLTNDHKLLKETIDILMSEPGAVEYYELVYKKLAVSNSSKKLSKLVGNWVIGDLLGLLNKNKMQIRQCPVTADRFASLLGLLISNSISGAQAKKVLQLMVNGSAESPENIAKANNWILDIDATQLEALCTEVIELHPDIIKKIQSGKERLMKFLIGEILKKTKGKANPITVSEILKKRIY